MGTLELTAEKAVNTCTRSDGTTQREQLVLELLPEEECANHKLFLCFVLHTGCLKNPQALSVLLVFVCEWESLGIRLTCNEWKCVQLNVGKCC